MKRPLTPPKMGSVLELHKLLASSGLIQVGGIVATMLLGIQLARYLEPANYGVYGVILSIVSIISVAAQFGLPLLAIKEMASACSTRSQADLGSVLRWFSIRAMVIPLLVIALATSLFFLWSPAWLAGREAQVLYAAATAFAFSVMAIGVGLLSGSGRNLKSQAIDAIAKPVLIILALLAVHSIAGGLTIDQVLAIQIAVSLICVFGTVVFVVRFMERTPAPRAKYAPHHWVSVSLSFLSTGLLMALNANYPILVAGIFVRATDLGVFRVALSSAAFVALPTVIANLAMAPTIAKLSKEGDKDGLADTLSHTTIATFASTALGLGILVLIGEPLIEFLFGGAYRGAYLPLLVLGAAQLIVAAFGVAGTYLNMSGHERLVIRAFVIAVPLGFLATIPLTWAFGIVGAACGNLCMVAFWHFYVVVIHRREVDAPLFVWSAWSHLRRHDRKTNH